MQYFLVWVSPHLSEPWKTQKESFPNLFLHCFQPSLSTSTTPPPCFDWLLVFLPAVHRLCNVSVNWPWPTMLDWTPRSDQPTSQGCAVWPASLLNQPLTRVYRAKWPNKWPWKRLASWVTSESNGSLEILLEFDNTTDPWTYAWKFFFFLILLFIVHQIPMSSPRRKTARQCSATTRLGSNTPSFACATQEWPLPGKQGSTIFYEEKKSGSECRVYSLLFIVASWIL